MRAHRELRRGAAHPHQPVEEQRVPQGELARHRDHGAQPGGHRHLLARALPELDERGRVAQELLAGRREGGTRLVAHEELAAEQLLQGLHAHAHRRLRDVQAFRRAHEVAGGDDLHEGAGEDDVHAF